MLDIQTETFMGEESISKFCKNFWRTL